MPRLRIPALLLLLSHSSVGSSAEKGSASFAPPPIDGQRKDTEQGHSQFDKSLDSFVRSLLACKNGAGADGTTAQLACVVTQVCSISYCASLRRAVSIGVRCVALCYIVSCQVVLNCDALCRVVRRCIASSHVASRRARTTRAHTHASAHVRVDPTLH